MCRTEYFPSSRRLYCSMSIDPSLLTALTIRGTADGNKDQSNVLGVHGMFLGSVETVSQRRYDGELQSNSCAGSRRLRASHVAAATHYGLDSAAFGRLAAGREHPRTRGDRA